AFLSSPDTRDQGTKNADPAATAPVLRMSRRVKRDAERCIVVLTLANRKSRDWSGDSRIVDASGTSEQFLLLRGNGVRLPVESEQLRDGGLFVGQRFGGAAADLFVSDDRRLSFDDAICGDLVVLHAADCAQQGRVHDQRVGFA